MSVSVLVKNSCQAVGEGPHWEESKQRLLYVDIHVGDLHVYDPATEQDTKMHFGRKLRISICCLKLYCIHVVHVRSFQMILSAL